jgi:hypothetical protein
MLEQIIEKLYCIVILTVIGIARALYDTTFVLMPSVLKRKSISQIWNDGFLFDSKIRQEFLLNYLGSHQ